MWQEEFEETKGVIKIRISKKDTEYNGQKKKYKRTNNDIQNAHKTTDRVPRTPLKTEDERRCSRMESSSCSTSDTRRVNVVTTPVHGIEI